MSAWGRMNRPNFPYAFIQWKGTDVCMDVHCICGFTGHIDGDFVYNVKCPKCNRVYACNPYIELVELTDDEIKDAGIIKWLQDEEF